MLAEWVAAALCVLPTSKLGPHVLGNTQDTGAQTLLQACPRVAKWLTPDGSVAAEISSYRARCPGGVVVLRVYVDGATRYATTAGAAASADDFWSKMQPGLSGIAPSQVDWVEGPNELDNLPDWYHDLPTANWFASFWSRLADLMDAAGYHPLVGSIAVGNPAMAGENGAGSPNYFSPIAAAMKSKGYLWGWSYHAYTKDLTQDPAQEIWYSLRYRNTLAQCALGGVPLVLTEGGQDIPTGWQGRGTTAAAFLGWLEWFDARMQEDPEVVGVTLFQVGEHGTWQNFDLGPVAAALAAYLAQTRPDGGAGDAGLSPDAGPADAGRPDAGSFDAGGPDGGADAGPADAGDPGAFDGGGPGGGGMEPARGGCGCGGSGLPAAAVTLALLGLMVRGKRDRRRADEVHRP